MKRNSLSKSVRAISLMAMLSIVVATTFQQPVQAQNGAGVLAKDANGTCVPLPDGTVYQEFGGIIFSPKQKAAYRKIEAKINKRYAVVLKKLKEVVITNGGLSVEFKPGIGKKKTDEINDASDKMLRDGLSTATQVRLLTEKYGKYAIFSLPKATVYTPETIAEGKQIGRDFEGQTMAILTPEQQKVYKVNLALQQRIQACGPSDTPNDRIISPLPY